MEIPRAAVITIQGGGAVAIDLVGQLQGLTGRQYDSAGRPSGDQGLLPVAVAGTSAGAIIAALYWSGYSPEAIRDEVVNLFAPSRIDRFFGRAGRFGIRFTEFVADLSAIRGGFKSFLGYLMWPGPYLWYLVPVWWLWQLVMVTSRVLRAIYALIRHRGIFPGDGLEREVDRLLRESPLLKDRPFPANRNLRFSDVGGDMPLFLVVTSVRKSKMILVSSIDPGCGNFCIAKAVRASAGFPGFFQPTNLSAEFETCVDGGMISNYPAWVFGFDYRRRLRGSRDKRLMRLSYVPWLHVGLRLPEDERDAPDGIVGFIGGLIKLVSGGARAQLDDKLATVVAKRRVVEPSVAKTDGAPRNVLDFAALSDSAQVNKAFARGRGDSQKAIEARCFNAPDPSSIQPILGALVTSAEFLLKPWLVSESKIRANIFLPVGDKLVLAYQLNMDGDVDEHIELSWGQGISSFVYLNHATVVADLQKRAQSGHAVAEGGDPYLGREGAPQTKADRTWLFSMPLIDVAEMWAEMWQTGATASFPLEMTGPELGVLNVDAAIDYAISNAPSPEVASTHPAVLALFDVMKSTAVRCGMEFNRHFI